MTRRLELQNRFYDRVRSRAARQAVEQLVSPGSFASRPEEKEHAEAAIQSNYGLGRRLYEKTADGVRAEEAYIEVAPAGQ
jgi:hypothetical protein